MIRIQFNYRVAIVHDVMISRREGCRIKIVFGFVHNELPSFFQGAAVRCSKVTKHYLVFYKPNHVAKELDMKSMGEALRCMDVMYRSCLQSVLPFLIAGFKPIFSYSGWDKTSLPPHRVWRDRQSTLFERHETVRKLF